MKETRVYALHIPRVTGYSSTQLTSHSYHGWTLVRLSPASSRKKRPSLCVATCWTTSTGTLPRKGSVLQIRGGFWGWRKRKVWGKTSVKARFIVRGHFLLIYFVICVCVLSAFVISLYFFFFFTWVPHLRSVKPLCQKALSLLQVYLTRVGVPIGTLLLVHNTRPLETGVWQRGLFFRHRGSLKQPRVGPSWWHSLDNWYFWGLSYF